MAVVCSSPFLLHSAILSPPLTQLFVSDMQMSTSEEDAEDDIDAEGKEEAEDAIDVEPEVRDVSHHVLY